MCKGNSRLEDPEAGLCGYFSHRQEASKAEQG